jgi:hypothetical protein
LYARVQRLKAEVAASASAPTAAQMRAVQQLREDLAQVIPPPWLTG